MSSNMKSAYNREALSQFQQPHTQENLDLMCIGHYFIAGASTQLPKFEGEEVNFGSWFQKVQFMVRWFQDKTFRR